MKRTALVVIDLQAGAFDPALIPALHRSEALLEQTSKLIEAARSAGVPVLFTQHCEPQGRPLAKGSEGWAIHPSLSPAPSDLTVLKLESSAFDGTDLQERLAKLGIDTIIACGIQSEFCVANTCISALELGLGVWLAQDAHSTRSTDDEDASLIIDRQNALLAGKGTKVESTAALLDALGAE